MSISLRKYLEATIKTERDKLKRITDAITIGLMIVNRGHVIELVNDAMINEFGEVKGRKCYEYFHDKTEPCQWCRNEEVFAGDTVKWEWYSRKTQKTYSLLDTPLVNLDGSLSKFAIFFDVTYIKQIQLRQKRELDFQMAVSEVTKVALSSESNIYDIALIINRHAMQLTDSVHGYVGEIDKDTNDMVAHSNTEMMNNGMCRVDLSQRKIVFPKGDSGYKGLWGHSLNTAKGFYTNTPPTHPSYKGCIPGGHVPIQRFLSVPAMIKDNLVGQIAIANSERDYTDEDLDIMRRFAYIYAIAIDRKRMEEALRIAKEFSESIINTAQAIILILGKQGEIIRFNPYMEELSGYTLDEVKGKSWFETFLPKRNGQRISKIFEQAIKGVQTRGNVNPIVTKDGRKILIEWYDTVLRNKNNETIGLLSIGQDITERKRMEDELKVLNTNLESQVAKETEIRQRNEQLLIQQSKMAAMGEMIALIAHQWKQPLNALSIFVQDLKDAYEYGELNNEYLDKMVASSMSQILFMSKTMDDFRNFFKPSKEKVIFDIKVAVEDLFSMFSGIFTKNDISIEVKEMSGSTLLANGYPNEFKQVMLNILNNSRDAIVFRKKAEAIYGHIEIAFKNNEDRSKTIISIRDNGGGIPDDVIERIFDPYYTTKGTEGTGIGLYMSKTIIETNMAGSLTVRNVDDGAEFTIALQSFH